MKVVIVGGVAGGATAAARLRRLKEDLEIVIIEQSGYVSYANCGLPYFIGNVITDKKMLTLQTVKGFWDRFRVDVRIKSQVTAINPTKKSLSITNLEDGTKYEENYDKLLLSPGSLPTYPDLPGLDNKKVFSLRTVEDTYKIKTFIDEQQPQSAVVIGGGFIGLEMAENLTHAGIKTTIIQRSKLMPPLDYDMAAILHNYIRKSGINLLLGKAFNGFQEHNGKILAMRKDAEPVEADMAILAIGVTPNTQLAKEAGLKLGVKNAIVVNNRMETSIPDIYAVGDAVEIPNFITGQKTVIALAGIANKQARIAANNICGGNSTFQGGQGSNIMKMFDLSVASTGLNEDAAQKAGLDYDKIILSTNSHATYYPNASNITLKTIFDKNSGKILGAEIIGQDGVDKRIDIFATAIRSNMTAHDLTELELAYAPPYSSAKDPVNMAGYLIENILLGKVKQFHWDDVETILQKDKVTLLDVRFPQEFAKGHFENALNIPVDNLRDRLSELDKTKLIYVNCQTGLRSYIACRILTQNGFECCHLAGGYRFYETVMQDKFHNAPTHACGVEI